MRRRRDHGRRGPPARPGAARAAAPRRARRARRPARASAAGAARAPPVLVILLVAALALGARLPALDARRPVRERGPRDGHRPEHGRRQARPRRAGVHRSHHDDPPRGARTASTRSWPAIRWCARWRSSTDFPHAMTIRVVEHRPAAMAVTGGAPRARWRRTAPCSRDFRCRAALPLVRAARRAQGQRGWPTRRRSRGARIAGAAPAALRRRLREIERDGDRGYVAQLRRGPELVFGSAARSARQVGRRGASARRQRRPGRRPTWTCACPAGRRWAASAFQSVTAPALPTAPRRSAPRHGRRWPAPSPTGPGRRPTEPRHRGAVRRRGPGAEQAPPPAAEPRPTPSR